MKDGLRKKNPVDYNSCDTGLPSGGLWPKQLAAIVSVFPFDVAGPPAPTP
jgi:hypothetical protein